MSEDKKKLEISASELELIANALETQSKILRMQAGAGGNTALVRLNEIKRLMATLSTHRTATTNTRPAENNGLWRMMRSMRQAT